MREEDWEVFFPFTIDLFLFFLLLLQIHSLTTLMWLYTPFLL